MERDRQTERLVRVQRVMVKKERESGGEAQTRTSAAHLPARHDRWQEQAVDGELRTDG